MKDNNIDSLREWLNCIEAGDKYKAFTSISEEAAAIKLKLADDPFYYLSLVEMAIVNLAELTKADRNDGGLIDSISSRLKCDFCMCSRDPDDLIAGPCFLICKRCVEILYRNVCNGE